jgi:hypothetical protein
MSNKVSKKAYFMGAKNDIQKIADPNPTSKLKHAAGPFL